jgi:DNA repair photolyase
MSTSHPVKAGPRGRAAVSNPACRFAATHTEAVDDGWTPEPAPRQARTRIHRDASRSVIARNDSPDVPFDRSVNPYRGCEHGCIYCFARPSHAYLGHSPGLDFETEIHAKPDVPDRLRAELARPGYRPATLALGANTDPYQPVERDLTITRRLLQVLLETRHPVAVITKSYLVTRDIDLLEALAAERLATVMVSITSLDNRLARSMEPRASAPRRRLEAIRRLTTAGIPCGVLASPMIPGLNDHELERILAAAAQAGAGTANTLLVRLPGEVKDLFQEWLSTHYPDRAERVLSLIRQCRNGALNDSDFGSRMQGRGPYAELLGQRFRLACRKLGLNLRHPSHGLDSARFTAPQLPGSQLSLF